MACAPRAGRDLGRGRDLYGLRKDGTGTPFLLRGRHYTARLANAGRMERQIDLVEPAVEQRLHVALVVGLHVGN